MSQPFRIAIAGLGTVGVGVVDILQKNAALLSQRCGRKIEIVSVLSKSKSKKRGVDISKYRWAADHDELLDGVDAVVELIGGSEGAALELARKALKRGVHVITANKAMIAHHGFELATLAEKNGASLAYEASVAGGVPIIKALREGLAANKITAVYGILNGTCNYILTQMRETGRGFNEVLKEAQALGYAEADPSFDVDGVDAGHKICILASLAFGVKPDFKQVHLRGIRELKAIDIAMASEFGYKIKLLGITKMRSGGLNIKVEPCLVPASSPLGGIEDVYNAVFVEGDFVETPFFSGRGAGREPTASAVVADIVDLARGLKIPTFGIPAAKLSSPKFIDPSVIMRRYYLRLTVLDKPGVIADVSAILRDHKISIESMVQRGRDAGKPVSVVLTTHEAPHGAMMKACAKISKLKSSVEDPCVMRIENTL